MKEFIKNNSKLLTIIIVVLLVSLVGVTLSLTIPDIGINISSGDYQVVYTGTTTLPSSNLTPILDSELTNSANASKVMKINFTVKGASTNPTDIPIIYDVSLTDLNLPEELKSKYLKWRLYKNTNEQVFEGNFSKDFDLIVNNRMVLTTTQQDLPSNSETADSYTFYIWISETCTGDITTCSTSMDLSSLINKTFSGKIRIELSTESKKELDRPLYAALKLIENKDGIGWSANTSPGLYATNPYTAEDGSTQYHDYRYVGAEPHNYVWFNNDMYRIIGIFDDYTHGVEGEYLVKLISANVLTSASYGAYTTVANQANGTYAGFYNDWVGNRGTSDTTDDSSPANLNLLLNQYFYNKTSGLSTDTYGICKNWTYNYNNELYRTNDCSDIVGYGINSDVRNYIETVTWHLKGYIGTGFSKENFYTCERSGDTEITSCSSGNSGAYAKSTTGKIGLMYVSDYIYASGYYASSDTINANTGYLGNQNWLYKGYEWTMTPVGNSDGAVFSVCSSGGVNSYGAILGHGVRPSLYLKSKVLIDGGEGTTDNPFTLSM